MRTPLTAARALHAALAEGRSGAELAALLTDDVVTTEYPNALKPTGATADRAAMLAASATGAGLLAWQRYDEIDAHEFGDTAAFRLTWSGEIARDTGPFSAGQVLIAHIAQFIRVREGRVSSIATYDCYEPFGG